VVDEIGKVTKAMDSGEVQKFVDKYAVQVKEVEKKVDYGR